MIFTEILQFSRIDRTMRYISMLDPSTIPRDKEFKFRERAKALVDKWTKYIIPQDSIISQNISNQAEKIVVASAVKTPGGSPVPFVL